MLNFFYNFSVALIIIIVINDNREKLKEHETRQKDR